MATRSKLYRCNLFSFGGPQTAGVDSDWSSELTPIGKEDVYDGEVIELYARIDGARHELVPNAAIRFDILEEDYLFTGGRDDGIVSILGTGAKPISDGFKTETRITEHHFLREDITVSDFLRSYKEGRENLNERLLLLEHYTDDRDHPTYHILTWWQVKHAGDWWNAEFYFLLNVDESFEDQSKTTIDIVKDAPTVRREETDWQPRTVDRQVHALLTTSLFDWQVTEDEALEAVRLLKTLPAEEVLHVMRALRIDEASRRKGQRLFKVLQDSQKPGAQAAYWWLAVEIGPNFGPIVTRDQIRIRVYADALDRAAVEPKHDGVFQVRLGGAGARGHVTLPRVNRVEITDLTPVDAANEIASAYFNRGFFHFPRVSLSFSKRPQYTDHPSKLAAPERAFEHDSTFRPLWSPEKARSIRKLALFTDYISHASNEPRSLTAKSHYRKWVEDNESTPEYFEREPHELWAWALREAYKPPPEMPSEKYLRLYESMKREADGSPLREQRRIASTATLYLEWLSENRAKLDSAQAPYEVWADFYHQVRKEEWEAEDRRRAAEARLPRLVDPEVVWNKMDEAIRFVQLNVWRPSRTEVVRWTEESGGFLGLFEERHRFSSLIQPSEAEKMVRSLVGSWYLDDLLGRLEKGQDLKVDIQTDFFMWLGKNPDLYRETLLAQSRPKVETSEIPLDIPAWQTVAEITIGFIPIVGHVVAGLEVATGRTIFGRPLTPAERAISGASILLPAAGKVFRLGSGALRTSRLVKEYGHVMTKGEIDALYRALLPIKPGSVKHTLLQKAVDDVEAGTFRATDEEVTGLKRLFDEMGLTDPLTRRRLNMPEGAALRGARLAPEKETTEFIFRALDGESATYRGLSRESRNTIRAAAQVEPDFLSRALRAETEQGFERYLAEISKRMGLHRAPKAQIDQMEAALRQLNQTRRARIANLIPPHASTRIRALGAASDIADEGVAMTAALRRREDRFRQLAKGLTGKKRRNALNNASRLKRERERVEKWLAEEAADSLPELVRAVGRDATLSRIAITGGSPMLRRAWIQFNTRSLKSNFARYTQILSRHYRGNLGEFEVAFRLGDTHIFLKAPDDLVTIRGTDLVAIPRTGGGDLLLLDNKAFLARTQVDDVGALTRNLPRNMWDDIEELRKVAGDPNMPTQLRVGLKRLEDAYTEIRLRFGPIDHASDAMQKEIAEILQRHGIKRAVTNAAGEVEELSPELRAMVIDLLDLN